MRFSVSEIVARALLLLAINAAMAGDLPSDAQIAARQRLQKQLSEDVFSQLDTQALAGVGTVNAPEAATLPEGRRGVLLNDVMEQYNQLRRGDAPRPGNASDLMIFVSFSMPAERLREYSRQARQWGASLVLRGMRGGSMKLTLASAKPLNPGRADWTIHPALFKRFSVASVPAIVLADGQGRQLQQGQRRHLDRAGSGVDAAAFVSAGYRPVRRCALAQAG
jgi:conjugal transfer pilus assembly protein TrbC